MGLFKKKREKGIPKILERREVILPSGNKWRVTRVLNGSVEKAKNKGLRRNDNL